ncbi:hypothetical protein [Streptomyces sp. NPDC058086]|uniref:hypothetical protein n=1 Tax=Streptomyces sp. NPDC058086 TaxID=3346334 RepID=UPI0036EBD27F
MGNAVAAPDWAAPALWLHGDLHPVNILAASWVLLPDGAADLFYGAYQPTPDAAPRCLTATAR